SWGGMLNGLMTLRGAWDRVREDAVLKFFVVAITAYGMATFEGPMLSLKSFNAITHFTDWIIAHVHIGGLGWNGFMIFGMIYWLVPKMWGTKLHSAKSANLHFWLGTLGILVYALPLYWGGVVQSLMWKQYTPDGFLQYANFLETVTKILPFYMLRLVGGTLYFTGVIIMVVNLIKTAKQGSFIANEDAEAPALEKVNIKGGTFHSALERKPIQFTIFTLVAILIGGAFELIPTYMVKSNIPTIASVKPYTPLELQGRDLYIREGCVSCHSQMVRPFRNETERYGEYSKAGEFVYDHPFLWGSRRTGPDLHRTGLGNKNAKPNSWHYTHMYDPRITSPGSIMPRYLWLHENTLDVSTTPAKIEAMQTLGVPYPEGYADKAIADLEKQAKEIADDLNSGDIETSSDKEIIALIAYLQRLGTDINGDK
ncbi:Cytochrome c oxidase (cbb3-type) subunit CcoN / Cytochrome c oxidase (cbb3-type) subunit CcoO, partial [hydrothermal vent metagenome]